MTIFYCARTTGGAARGAGVLRALGEGVLVTPYRIIAMREGLPWMRQVPIPQADDLLIYDKIEPCRTVGRRVVVGREWDADLVIDWPIVARLPSEPELIDAEDWWGRPVEARLDVYGRGLEYVAVERPPTRRVLTVRGGPTPKVRRFMRDEWVQGAHFTVYGPRFWWPAAALMATADEVIGGDQVRAEWSVARGNADPDGARRAAGKIKRLKK